MKNSHDVVVDVEGDGVSANHLKREKLIIDTDPGIGEFSASICLIFSKFNALVFLFLVWLLRKFSSSNQAEIFEFLTF